MGSAVDRLAVLIGTMLGAFVALSARLARGDEHGVASVDKLAILVPASTITIEVLTDAIPIVHLVSNCHALALLVFALSFSASFVEPLVNGRACARRGRRATWRWLVCSNQRLPATPALNQPLMLCLPKGAMDTERFNEADAKRRLERATCELDSFGTEAWLDGVYIC